MILDSSLSQLCHHCWHIKRPLNFSCRPRKSKFKTASKVNFPRSLTFEETLTINFCALCDRKSSPLSEQGEGKVRLLVKSSLYDSARRGKVLSFSFIRSECAKLVVITSELNVCLFMLSARLFSCFLLSDIWYVFVDRHEIEAKAYWNSWRCVFCSEEIGENCV